MSYEKEVRYYDALDNPEIEKGVFMSTAFAFEHTEVKLKTFYQDISPSLAAKYLEHNINNRSVSKGYVSFLAKIMLSGEYSVNHQGIAFDEDGNLVDGQHRLHAIVKSGVTVSMLVTSDLSKKAVRDIDSGRKRRYWDNQKMLGDNMHPLLPSVARTMFITKSLSQHAIPNAILDDVVKKYRPALDFAMGEFFGVTSDASAQLRVASVIAVVARAYYSADFSRLREFVKVFMTGVVKDEGDTAATKLRDYRLIRGLQGANERTELYKKTENALHSFLQHKPIIKLHSASDELFPIPE